MSPFERAFIPQILKQVPPSAAYVSPYNPKEIDHTKIAPSLTCLNSSLDDSRASTDVPGSNRWIVVINKML